MKEINSITQLHSVVRRDVFTSFFNKIPDYKLSIPSTSEERNNQISCLLNRYKNECGCFVGGLFIGISVIVTTSYFLMSEKVFLELDWSSIFGVVGIIFASSVIGKIVGKLFAKVQMYLLVNRVAFSKNNM